jgi:hypothetical protein
MYKYSLSMRYYVRIFSVPTQSSQIALSEMHSNKMILKRGNVLISLNSTPKCKEVVAKG